MKNLSITKIVSCLMFIAVLFPNDLAAQWSGSSLTNSTHRNGNVGIGQSSPSALLHIKSTYVLPRATTGGTIPGYMPLSLRLENQDDLNQINYWDIRSGSSLEFLSGTTTSSITSRMSISSSILHFKGNNIRGGLNENEFNLGAQNAPNGNLGQFIAFGARGLSGGYQFTGNSSNNGGSIITGDDKGNLFFITRNINGSNTMTPTQTAANVKLFIKNDGNIGIGTNTLASHEQLAVRGGAITTEGIGNGISLDGSLSGSINNFGTRRYGLFLGDARDLSLSVSQGGEENPVVLSGFHGLGFDVANGKMALCENGVLIIGGNNNDIDDDIADIAELDPAELEYHLYVQRGIRTERARVDLKSTWADYVFEEAYDLPKLTEVEQFIATNKHLPNVPSAAEVKANGIDVAEMDETLLRKIEELTLYTIEQQKTIEATNKELAALKAQMAAIQKALEKSK